jgi:hypothetical protein
LPARQAGGATWTAPTTPSVPPFIPWIGFTDATVGAALVQIGWDAAAKIETQALRQTADGGADWSKVRFG